MVSYARVPVPTQSQDFDTASFSNSQREQYLAMNSAQLRGLKPGNNPTEPAVNPSTTDQLGGGTVSTPTDNQPSTNQPSTDPGADPDSSPQDGKPGVQPGTTPSTSRPVPPQVDLTTLQNLQNSLAELGYDRDNLIVEVGTVRNDTDGRTLRALVSVPFDDFSLAAGAHISEQGEAFTLRATVPLRDTDRPSSEVTAPLENLGTAYDTLRNTVLESAADPSLTPEQRLVNTIGAYAMLTSATSQALDSIYGIRGEITEDDQRRITALLEGSQVLPVMQYVMESSGQTPPPAFASGMRREPSTLVADLASALSEE